MTILEYVLFLIVGFALGNYYSNRKFKGEFQIHLQANNEEDFKKAKDALDKYINYTFKNFKEK